MDTQFTHDAVMLDACRNRIGKVLENSCNERLTTQQIHEGMLVRARQEPQFRRELFNHPELVWALALEEQMGINAKHFFEAIRTVELHQEAEGLLYVKIPACHGGCKAPGVHPPSECDTGESCHVCGLPFKLCKSNGKSITEANNMTTDRAYVERRIRERAIHEPAFRQDLCKHPLETYVRAVQEIIGGTTPDYLKGIQKIIILEERPDEIHIIVPRGI